MPKTVDPKMSRRETFAILWKTVPKSLVALLIAALALTVTFIIASERSYRNIAKGVVATRDGRDKLGLIFELQTLLLNAETAQRGYLLSGNKSYLAPLDKAKEDLPGLQQALEHAFANQPERLAQVDQLATTVNNKFVSIETAVALAEAGKYDEALRVVDLNAGNALMSDARRKVAVMIGEMDLEVEQMRAFWARDTLVSRLGMLLLAALNLILLGFVVYLFMLDLMRKQLLVALRNDENERLGSLVAERTDELNELSSHLQTSTERDRATLARDLHDELGGILTSVKMDLDWLRNHSSLSAEGEARCDQISGLIDDAVAVKRQVVENLRPSLLDNMGLAAALEWHLTEQCDRSGLVCNLSLSEGLGSVSPDTAIAIFRIVQEATTNVLRHAKAHHLSVSLWASETDINLILQDDGSGLPSTYNPMRLSHGLSGMRQRARSLGGDAVWKSVPGTGTTVTVSIPRLHSAVCPPDAAELIDGE